MNCPACQHDNPQGSRFCLECGSAFGLRCPSCDAELPATARFCNECGAATDAPAAKASPAERAAPDPRAYTPKHQAYCTERGADAEAARLGAKLAAL